MSTPSDRRTYRDPSLPSTASAITVVRVELMAVRLPLRRSFATSSHRKDHLDHILVKLTDQDGAEGWGECASPSHPYYGPETFSSCWSALRDYFAPALIGERWDHPEELETVWRRIRGNLFARAALDTACWDLYAQHGNRSLASALGGSAEHVEAGVSLGIEESIGELLNQVEDHVGQGYRRIKLKIAPGWDVAPVAAVRARFPDTPLQVDANAAYSSTVEHRTVMRALDTMALRMIEQPFATDDLLAHAELQRELTTPICLDESITSASTAHTALSLGAAKIINIKVSRLGGLTEARRVHDLCARSGIPVWCGGMHEFGVGRAANLAVAALPGFTLPGDISGSDRYFTADILSSPITATRGRVRVPSAAGLGVTIDRDAVRTHLLDQMSVTQ
ncbi:o-succinylbenzoate synthase [Streptomyces sp. NPDC058623]|uniref:o-succinylbenzoate synthase n=1 Tax=Streptomyces sp. NPDC058623 TaxID=3346563 RepID=UPI0036690D9B